MPKQVPLRREVNNLRALLADKDKQINILEFKLENREKFINNLSYLIVKSKPKKRGILKGENHGRSKLTTEQVDCIRKFYRSGIKRDVLATTYNVSISTVCKIIYNKTYTYNSNYHEQTTNTN